ncbi:MAG: adenosylmethionine decarboxylase [Gammaproteobacteria bacterium]|nr:MAG: adenosylmethionine decarboxylase [Gammaproteobacteria bacterium]
MKNDQNNSVKDYFKTSDKSNYAGDHIIVDFWGASHLDDLVRMERAFKEAVEVSGATLLHIHLHSFSSTGGISGVAVLAESHISVHTWPEKSYAAFDIFMCGNADAKLTVPIFERIFSPKEKKITSLKRGEIPYIST